MLVDTYMKIRDLSCVMLTICVSVCVCVLCVIVKKHKGGK